MLKDPEQFAGAHDPMLKILYGINSPDIDTDFHEIEDEAEREAKILEARRKIDDLPGIQPEKLEDGVFVCPGFNFSNLVGVHDFEMNYPNFPMVEDDWLNSYGVCDSPEQFLNKYRSMLQADSRTFCVGFSHVPKTPGEGGWRWHKWGPYVGDGEPQCEYLADEDEFEDGVYVYQIVQIAGENLNEEYNPFKEFKKAASQND